MAMNWGGAGTGAAIGAGVGMAAGPIGILGGVALGGALGGLFGGKKKKDEPSIWEQMALKYFPEEYEVQDDYTETQSYLKELGYDLLEGDIPDYYKPIGETGGPEFEAVVDRGITDISRSIWDDIAAKGISRGGVGTTAIGQSVAPFVQNMRMQDWTRAMNSRAGFFDTGVGITENARTSALNMTNMQNTWNLNRFNSLLGRGQADTNLQATQASNRSSMWGEMASSAMGAAGTYFGMKASSDKRLKKNIRYTGKKIRGICEATWEWNNIAKSLYGLDGTSIGLIAQDVQESIPHAVIKDANGYLLIDYSKILEVA